LDASAENYDVQFSITNVHSDPLVLLKWNTPLDRLSPFPSDMFYIRPLQGGKSPVYVGTVQKRFPVPFDFVTIRPNETLKVTLDLLAGYWFPSIGEYEVMFSASVFVHAGLVDIMELDAFESLALASTPISVAITNLAPMPKLFSSTAPLKGIAFENCSKELEQLSETANNSALAIVDNVIKYLDERSCDDADLSRYITWFGVCDVQRYRTVAGNFAAIKTRMTTGYRMFCNPSGCGGGVYAYVYPNDPTFTVYVCGGYVNARNCDIDSKAGTIIHEISHFNSVAGTNDHAYGVTNCQNLARNQPQRAVNNADNHEYMAEVACPL